MTNRGIDLEAEALRCFPPDLVECWRARAAAEAPGWEAGMYPLFSDKHEDAFFWLRLKGHHEPSEPSRVHFQVRFSGTDQDSLIKLAQQADLRSLR